MHGSQALPQRSVGQAAVRGSPTIWAEQPGASIKLQVAQQRGGNQREANAFWEWAHPGSRRLSVASRHQAAGAAPDASGLSDRSHGPQGLAGDPPCPTAAPARTTGSSRTAAALTVSSAAPPKKVCSRCWRRWQAPESRWRLGISSLAKSVPQVAGGISQLG